MLTACILDSVDCHDQLLAGLADDALRLLRFRDVLAREGTFECRFAQTEAEADGFAECLKQLIF